MNSPLSYIYLKNSRMRLIVVRADGEPSVTRKIAAISATSSGVAVHGAAMGRLRICNEYVIACNRFKFPYIKFLGDIFSLQPLPG